MNKKFLYFYAMLFFYCVRLTCSESLEFSFYAQFKDSIGTLVLIETIQISKQYLSEEIIDLYSPSIELEINNCGCKVDKFAKPSWPVGWANLYEYVVGKILSTDNGENSIDNQSFDNKS